MNQNLIGNRYEIRKQLGQGAQATVFLACDITTNKNVALKLLSAKMTTNAKNVIRFQREFSVCKNWDSPNIIKLYDSGLDKNAGYFYTMEYLPYPTVGDRIDSNGPLSPLETVNMLIQLSRGLEVAHKDGIIHRDIKPENVIIAPEDRFILVDFGLARDLDATALTATGTVLGTPYLMAPEMILGSRVDLRADIYSLGVLGWYSLAKRYPYEGDTIPSLLCSIVSKDEPPLLTDFKATVPPKLAAIIKSMMVKDPDARVQSSIELRRALSKSLKPDTSYTPISTDSEVFRKLENVEIKKTTGKNPLNSQKDRKAGKDLSSKITNSLKPQDLTESIEEKYNFTGHRTLIILFLSVIVISGIALWTLLPRKIVYSYSNLTTICEPELIFARWTSTEPYKSLLETSSPFKSQFRGNEDKPVKEHQVALGPFKNLTVCNFQIVYPDGRKSLSHSAKMKKVSLKLPPYEGKGTESLSIESTLSKGGAIELQKDNGTKTTLEGIKEGNSWTLPLPRDLKDIEKSSLILDYPSGERSTLNLSEILVSQLPSIKGSLFNADLESFRTKMNNKTDEALKEIISINLAQLDKTDSSQLSADQMERIRRLASGQAVAEIDKEFGVSRTYYEKLKWFPLVFESGLFSLKQQEETYDSFCAAMELSTFSQGIKAKHPLIFKAFPESMGSFTTSASKTMDLQGVKPIFEVSDENTMILAPLSLHFWTGRINIKKLSAVIDGLQSVKEAELVLYLNPYQRFLIQIIVNDHNRLQPVCHPYVGSEYKESEKIYLRQRIPLEYLKEGQNTIELRAIQALTNGAKNQTFVTKIWLNLKTEKP